MQIVSLRNQVPTENVPEMMGMNPMVQNTAQPMQQESDSQNSKHILTLLHILSQVRVFHWQTESYAQHVALGEYYDSLTDTIDEFVEAYQGNYCRIALSSEDCFNIGLKGYNVQTLSLFVEEVEHYLKEILPQTFNEDDSELLNIRDEMLSATDKLSYLLTLK